MNDLDQTYERMARTCAQEDLAARYASAKDRGARVIKSSRAELARALPTLATAVPPAATLDVAVYVLHLLRDGAQGDLAGPLVETAERNAAAALHLGHRALELDAAARGYTAEEWLPVVCKLAAELLKPARLNEEPPTMVRIAQDAISWLSRALIELDRDSAEAPNALSEVLARLLAIQVFAETAADLDRSA